MLVNYSAVNPHHLLTHIECAGELHVHVEVCNVRCCVEVCNARCQTT